MKFNNREEIKNILKMDISNKDKKNLIANLKNHKSNLGRTIKVNYELDIKEGQIWDNQGVATSWTDRSVEIANTGFRSETDGDIEYILFVDGVKGYQVQYFNYDSLESLGLEDSEIDSLLEDEVYDELMDLLGSDGDMEDEAEVLVPAESKFEVVEINDGRDDIGYIEVMLKEI